MRPVLNSGWTVWSLLLAGVYLLGFAGAALAEDYPQADVPVPVSGNICNLVGTPNNPTSCTHYDTWPCQDTIGDTNFDDIRPLRWVRRVHHRHYGVCIAYEGQQCLLHQTFPCAKLRIWQHIADCQADNANFTLITVIGRNVCNP